MLKTEPINLLPDSSVRSHLTVISKSKHNFQSHKNSIAQQGMITLAVLSRISGTVPQNFKAYTSDLILFSNSSGQLGASLKSILLSAMTFLFSKVPSKHFFPCQISVMLGRNRWLCIAFPHSIHFIDPLPHV